MKIKIIGIIAVCGVLMLTTPAVAQITPEEVTADISTEILSITIEPSAWDYGIVLSGGNISPDSPSVAITNVGNIDTDYEIKGSNAVGGTGGTTEWALADVPGLDQYVNLVGGLEQNLATEGIVLRDVWDLRAESVAPGSSSDCKFAEITPTEITDPGAYSTQIYVRAIASP